MFRKNVVQAIATILVFLLVGVLFGIFGFIFTPQGSSGEYSAFSLGFSVAWVLAVSLGFFFSGARNAKGVLTGYSVLFLLALIGTSPTYLVLFFVLFWMLYFAPVASIAHATSIAVFNDYSFYPIFFAYTTLNYMAWLLGYVSFEKRRKRLAREATGIPNVP